MPSCIAMFNDDLTPSAAWEKHRKDIQEKFPGEYHTMFGDRHVCPDYLWVFKFYHKWVLDTLGTYDGVDAYVKVVEFVNEYMFYLLMHSMAEGLHLVLS